MQSYYDQYPGEITPVRNKNIDLKKIEIANMNEIVFASPKKPIIGTYALATCVGIIMSDNKGTYALGHILNDYDLLIKEMLKPMLNNNPIKIVLIPGFYTSSEKLKEIIDFLNNKEIFLNYDFEIEIKNMQSYKNPQFRSIEFAYNTETNEYIKPNYDELILQNRRR